MRLIREDGFDLVKDYISFGSEVDRCEWSILSVGIYVQNALYYVFISRDYESVQLDHL